MERKSPWLFVPPALKSPVAKSADTSGRRESVRFESVAAFAVPWRSKLVGGVDGELLRRLVEKQAGRSLPEPKTCGDGSVAPKRKIAADSAVRTHVACSPT